MNEKTLLSAADDATNLNGEANAHLIASAPALLEALKNCVSWLETKGEDRSTYGKVYDYVEVMRNAIAKAEGRSV